MTKKPKTKTRGQKVIDWIQRFCRIPEGPDVGQKVRLRPFQKKIIIRIYDNPAGTRRAIISVGRKNAKTTLAAFLLLAHIAGPEAVGRRNSQLYSSAQSKEQAGVIFELAAKIIRMSPELSAFCVVRDTVKQILCPEMGTKYRALSAEVKTSFGLGPAFIVHDELGQVRGPQSPLYEALETATAAQDRPLSIIISTQAPTDADLLSVLIDDAKADNDPKTVLELYTADPELDPFSEEAIRQANPAFGDFQNADEVLAMARDAARMPSRESDYRNLILNQRVEATAPFVSKVTWQSCGGRPRDFDSKTPVYAGLDLSAVNDLTAFVPIFSADGLWHVRPTFWLPQEGIHERSRLDRVPYDVWSRQGQLELCPGKTVDYEYVADYLRDFCGEFSVRKIAFDRWGFRHLKSWLLKAGFSEIEVGDGKTEEEKKRSLFVEFGQGFQSMSPALRALESLLLNGKLRHGDHPVLAMCAANAVVQKDPAGNRKLNKAKSRGRIDGMVALAMAVATAESAPETQQKTFQMMFV